MTQNNLAIIVLAAGQGTRMKSRRPKVLHEIAGRPLVGHVLTTARSLGAAHIEVVVRHEREQVVSALAADYPDAVFVDQDDVPGTGRAVQVAIDALPADFDGDVLVLSGDCPLADVDTLSAFLDEHRASGAPATLMTAVVDDPTGYGRVIRDAEGGVDRIVEQKDASDDEAAVREINAGMYVFRSETLRRYLPEIGVENAQGEMYLTDVPGLLRRDGDRVAASVVSDVTVTYGVNDRAQLALVGRLLNQRIVRHWQREGVTIVDPETTWIDDDAKLAPDVTILPNTQILRATVIAAGATVGPDTTLVDCEIGEDAVVKRTDANLAVIGANATVGPFSFLRPGTVLGAGGKIGAYVETKNAEIGEGSKVPHLSYVGDATIGRGVNLGASTITANYDDVNKHRTVVGDEVHTGSHTVLVAPVRLGAGAKTGAGAVVRKDVPAGALAMSVAPQRNIDGWVEKNRAGTGAADAAARERSAE
ncbi:bifunctional UDP-N-acetylglucosamine diphosphorylase/glucosamine-1-phosphate N-acetyltransferase GlmU [Microbacterium esteraromaticum]|uniref:bifunctional UDP-N-acetylglucosamine diphosphorylase/glucosamine-1-phosphate N-acetyltransferase GlmU n=1 Tax=Microbacterium esteraromaticum TaxID=57043 RepID=UPI000C081E36|nr:bifunctional UDP-N-acetylglucosamine diphosphorylase/glucosamine-1-phosphate N-acetyltransferase GlmU [Microbacterium esteraromaticum]